MVNHRRIDHIHNQEPPIRDGFINRREILRRQLIRERSPAVRRLFVDRDEVPDDIVRALNDNENIPLELSFAPLSPPPFDYIAPSPIAVPAEAESDEDTDSTTGYTESVSDCPTVEIDLDVNDVRIPLGLLRAWERNAEIQPLVNVETQTSPMISPPGSPTSSDYSGPNYSPVRLGELENLQWADFDYLDSPEPFFSDTDPENLIEETEIDRVVNLLDNEERSLEFSPEL